MITLRLLMGKFCQFLTELSAPSPPPHTHAHYNGEVLSFHVFIVYFHCSQGSFLSEAIYMPVWFSLVIKHFNLTAQDTTWCVFVNGQMMLEQRFGNGRNNRKGFYLILYFTLISSMLSNVSITKTRLFKYITTKN